MSKNLFRVNLFKFGTLYKYGTLYQFLYLKWIIVMTFMCNTKINTYLKH